MMGAAAFLNYGHRFVCGRPSVFCCVAFKQIHRIRGKDENKDGATADPAYGLCRAAAAAASSLSSLPG